MGERGDGRGTRLLSGVSRDVRPLNQRFGLTSPAEGPMFISAQMLPPPHSGAGRFREVDLNPRVHRKAPLAAKYFLTTPISSRQTNCRVDRYRSKWHDNCQIMGPC